MNHQIELDVNGSKHRTKTDPRRSLLEVLREDLGLTGAKYGCGEGECRACTVLADERPVPACRLPVAQAAGRRILTIEGLAAEGELHPVQRAFVAAGAMQCGYCVPGMILATVALLAQTPQPSRQQITEALNGNLCRCCGYARIFEAVELAARQSSVTSHGQ
jgi:aerobic-type carbon monoxide dehydrogenase small subunit (CoxS/CutS family)